MYTHSAYSRTSPKPKNSSKNDGNSIFRMPSPLSPTFITTQSLVRAGLPDNNASRVKKERINSSSSYSSSRHGNQHAPISPKMVTTGTDNNRAKQHVSMHNNNNHTNNHNAMSSKDEELEASKMLEGRSSEKCEGGQRVSRAQVYLPGDHVIFAESPSAPGIPIVYRLEEERRSNPDKLNLDRRKLTMCPILEGEENLRLLNYQHNYIKRIQHLELIRKLIFLDLYDNQIEEMSGLASLKLLRVLMLGKNRVTKIANLQQLIMLDVLDLHGNQISKIEGVDHLKHLRVLNLAGNQLTHVDGLTGLASLSELNLRRNAIESVDNMDKLPCLQRLFLSFNNIKHFNDVASLASCPSLIELSLDGNPFAKSSDYKQVLIQNMSNLRQLDMKRLTDEEKRFAHIAAKREEDKQRENERLTSLKEKRHLAISNAQRKWNQQTIADEPLPRVNSCEALERKSPARVSPTHESIDLSQCTLKGVDRVKSLSSSHLAELDNNSLNLYGTGSLEALDKEWGEKVVNNVHTVHFKFINFGDIVQHLCKLCVTFPSLRSLHFDMTNIVTLNQLDMLSLLPWLDNLNIIPTGNPVTKLSLWKPYVLYRLEHAQLKTLNNVDVTRADILKASNLFEPVSQVVNSKLPKHRKLMLQATYRNLALQELHNNSLWFDNPSSSSSSSSSSVCCDKTEAQERKQFAVSYVNEIVQNGILADRKIKLLDECWSKFMLDLIKTSLNEMEDIDVYCQQSLERMKKM